MKSKRGCNLNRKDECVRVRVSKRLKNSLDRKAKQKNMNFSDYVRHLLKEGLKKEKSSEKSNKKSVRCTVLCQEITNYIEEKYDCEENEILKEMVDKLWKELS